MRINVKAAVHCDGCSIGGQYIYVRCSFGFVNRAEQSLTRRARDGQTDVRGAEDVPLLRLIEPYQ